MNIGQPFRSANAKLSLATEVAEASEVSWPPPPHDPRERELALVVDDWEVRIFGGRHFQYFLTRGMLHVQLWHPAARFSVLTPSRLTSNRYEIFPVAEWKARADDYEAVAAWLKVAGAPSLPSKGRVYEIERAFVRDIARDTDAPNLS